MLAQLDRCLRVLLDFIYAYPWSGWAGWIAFCVIEFSGIHLRRLGAAFSDYMEAARNLVAQAEIYDPATLGNFLYLPVALVVLAPFTAIDIVTAAAIMMLIYCAVFTFGAIAIMKRLLPSGSPNVGSLASAGILLLITVPGAWFSLKGIQSQVVMTGAMMTAAAMMMSQRWLWASFWLFVAIVFKPLAMVMVLLCGALVPQMRLPLAGAVLAALALPFVFFDAGYLSAQYQAYALKLWSIAAAPPGEWVYQADFTTLLKAFGVLLPGEISIVIRLAAALATLALAARLRANAGPRSFGLAVLMLSGFYLTLFGPRNEFNSYVVLAPSLAALALVMLARDDGDRHAWLLVGSSLALGMVWNVQVDVWLKPAIDLAILIWLGAAMAQPQRWSALAEYGRATEQTVAVKV